MIDPFASKNEAAQRVLAMARRVAVSETSLLLLGETGVGRDHLARAIHGAGARSRAPFIAVNCGAVPDTLLEGELFGHAKGAFTGAVREHHGYFEQAHGGTLFLDEVAEMPAHLQVSSTDANDPGRSEGMRISSRSDRKRQRRRRDGSAGTDESGSRNRRDGSDPHDDDLGRSEQVRRRRERAAAESRTDCRERREAHRERHAEPERRPYPPRRAGGGAGRRVDDDDG